MMVAFHRTTTTETIMNTKLILESLEEAVRYAKIDLAYQLKYEQSILDGSCTPCCRPSLEEVRGVTKQMQLRHNYAVKAHAAFERLIAIETKLQVCN